MVVGSTLDKVFMVMELGDADLKECIEKVMSTQTLAAIDSYLNQRVHSPSNRLVQLR